MSHAEIDKGAAVCNAQFPGQLTDVEFEASLSNSLQHSLHISGLKHEQKLCLVTVAHKHDVFEILPTGLGRVLFFSIYLFSYTTQVNSGFRAI